MVEGAFEFGGDDVARAYFTNGDRQDIRAGQGGTLAAGVHYKLAGSPWDFAATLGYKFVRTEDFHVDVGVDRVVVKLVGNYAWRHDWWVEAGPVWHTHIRFNGDDFVPDIRFDDAFGGTVGVGWNFIGLTYTNIHYHSGITGDLDASNVGAIVRWKF